MTRIFILAAALTLCGCVHKPPAAGPFALDELLTFSNPAECEPSDEHAALLRAMWAGGDDEGFRAGKIIAPAQLAKAFGPIRIAKHESYTTVSVATRGTLFGLPLVEIVQAFPEGGDPGDTTYRFAATPAEVERAAGRLGLPARAGKAVTLADAGVYDHFIELRADPSHARLSLLTCGLQ